MATTQPTWVLLGITGVTALITGVFGFVAGLTPVADRPPRLTLLVTGLVGSICFIIWTVSASLGAAAGSAAAEHNLALWVSAAAVFAFVPALIALTPARADAASPAS
ncbi:hypothetical protein GY21_01545 [Cryobacterium roopkundense]|uniref:Uncharacterized protein n=1 Tax=Cryobacterium roopkundense TaxID=1001240 RepID=A0A099JTQ8_9MICO|nr:hypothetical protein [Cryobacterium roopkundense]KGJ81784.1 hypothetical protein GY21_01545 [Cryobacterium roopkundense]